MILSALTAIASPCYRRAVKVALDRDSLHIICRRTKVGVIERVLCRRHRASLLGDYSGVSVPRLVQVHVSEPRLSRVELQVAHKSM